MHNKLRQFRQPRKTEEPLADFGSAVNILPDKQQPNIEKNKNKKRSKKRQKSSDTAPWKQVK